MTDLLVRGGEIDPRVVRDVLEMRASIGADAARLCAVRSPGVGPALKQAAATMETLHDQPAELERVNREYWTALVDGSSNIAYRLALNTLLAGLVAVDEAPGGPALKTQLLAEYRRAAELHAIADAITDGQAGAAERAAATLLGGVAEAAGRVIEPFAGRTTGPRA